MNIAISPTARGRSYRSRHRLLAGAGALLLVTALLLVLACSSGSSDLPAREQHPRVVLLTFDTLNLDFVGAYNPQVDYTPNLDQLAAESVLFERAYTRVPITLPSHASLFTGRRARDLGVMFNGMRVPDDAETLAEVLSQAGYATGAFVSLGVLHSSSNIAQGFDTYEDGFQSGKNRWYLYAHEVLAAASGWIREHADEPFFLWLHLSDPHEPYLALSSPPDVRLTLDGEDVGSFHLASKEDHSVELSIESGQHRLTWTPLRQPRTDDLEKTALRLQPRSSAQLEALMAQTAQTLPEELELRRSYSIDLHNRSAEPVTLQLEFSGWIASPPPSEVLANYRLEVAHADRVLGELRSLLDELQLEEETLWLLTSDHGEGLFRHGVRGHAIHGYEDQLRVMWMMKGPTLPQGRRLAGQKVLVEDMAPTLLEILDLPKPADITGKSRIDCWSAQGCEGSDGWWAFGAYADPLRLASVTGYSWPYKILWRKKTDRIYLFDLSQDPGEEHDLLAAGESFSQENEGLVQQLLERLQAEKSDLESQFASGDGDLQPETIEALRELGYLN